MNLTLEDMRRLVQILSSLTDLANDVGRGNVLRLAGLERFIATMAPGLNVQNYVVLLLSELQTFGIDPAAHRHVLAMYLDYIQETYLVGRSDDRNFVRALIGLPPIELTAPVPPIPTAPVAPNRITILFLAANPTATTRLRLDAEYRQIDQRLLAARFRDRFMLELSPATRRGDLQQAFLRFTPNIVHFSGHGSERSEIILEDANGGAAAIPREALSSLFNILNQDGQIRCVVLNACYSQAQAEGIAESVDCVVGMADAIGDNDAIAFAEAFYQALAYGRSVKQAFELGKNAIDLQRLPDAFVPQLITRAGVDPAAITFA
ncbi:MAG TPA: CHAT domain-containing protein [Aggregatilineales bacterium]|nr:CHAT domain-containing protein [Anaerolineales bacterium]HRE46861.1 CHAT domain-containing protein [Aggregatilineales bacterium]